MIPDWLTATPRRRRGTATEAPLPTVTPEPRTPTADRNQYGALATPIGTLVIPVDHSPAGTHTVPTPLPEPPGLGDNDPHKDTDSIEGEETDWLYDHDTMPSTIDEWESLVSHMPGQGTGTPIADPTLMDLINYKTELATALTKCSMDKYFGGYVFIIMNDEEEYQNRIGDQDKKHPLPEIPTRPSEPTEPTRTNLFKFSNQKKKYKEYLKYNQEAVDMLERKFPGGLNGLKDDAGNLPIQLPIKAALDHITNNIVAEPAKDHSRILQGLLTRTYQPNAKGAEDYFVKADSDRLMAKHLGFPYIPYSMIMSAAQTAFAGSDFDSELIHKIDTEWNAKRASNQQYKDTDSRDCYRAFKDHYNKGLKVLYKHKPPSKKGRAHSAIDQDWKDQVEGTVYELHSALNTIRNSSMDKSTVTPPTETICIPAGTASTVAMSATTFVTKDMIQQTEDRLMDFMKRTLSNNNNNNNNNNSGGSNNRRGNVRRQTYMPYKFWCFSCGTNISHDTRDCRTKARQGHDQHLTATINDPQGGNTSRDDRFGKYNGPMGVIVDSIPAGN